MLFYKPLWLNPLGVRSEPSVTCTLTSFSSGFTWVSDQDSNPLGSVGFTFITPLSGNKLVVSPIPTSLEVLGMGDLTRFGVVLSCFLFIFIFMLKKISLANASQFYFFSLCQPTPCSNLYWFTNQHLSSTCIQVSFLCILCLVPLIAIADNKSTFWQYMQYLG